MSRMPPSFSGGFVCAKTALADSTSTDARTPENTRHMETSLPTGRIRCGLTSVAAIMPEGGSSGKARGCMPPLAENAFSAKRNGTRFDATSSLQGGSDEPIQLAATKLDCLAKVSTVCRIPSVQTPGAFEIRRGQKYMREAVDLHRLPFVGTKNSDRLFTH